MTRTLKECFPKLVGLVQQSPGIIGDSLFAEGILSEEDQDHLQNHEHTAREKARKIVHTVITRERSSQNSIQYYQSFIRALASEGKRAREVIELIESIYQTKKLSTQLAKPPHYLDSQQYIEIFMRNYINRTQNILHIASKQNFTSGKHFCTYVHSYFWIKC